MIKNRKKENKYIIDLLEKAFMESDADNINGYLLETVRKNISEDIINGVIVPSTNKYYVDNEWIIKLDENNIYIISDYICSVIDLNKEELYNILPAFNDRLKYK